MPKKNKRYEREQKINADRRELILKLYSVEDRKQTDIADIFNITRQRVNAIIKESGIETTEVP